jgi:hypothetical protein
MAAMWDRARHILLGNPLHTASTVFLASTILLAVAVLHLVYFLVLPRLPQDTHT